LCIKKKPFYTHPTQDILEMAKYKIEFDREACIGAAACVVSAPEFWKITDDGRADLLKGAKYNETTKKW